MRKTGLKVNLTKRLWGFGILMLFCYYAIAGIPGNGFYSVQAVVAFAESTAADGLRQPEGERKRVENIITAQGGYSITIVRRFPQQELEQLEDGTHIIFRAQRLDHLGNVLSSQYRTIYPKEYHYYVDTDGYVSISTVFSVSEQGQYCVSELGDTWYDLENNGCLSLNASVNNNTVTFWIGEETDDQSVLPYGTVTFFTDKQIYSYIRPEINPAGLIC